MHELGIAESICRSVMERVGKAAVEEMVVEVGALSGVNRDSLEFCLGEAAQAAGMSLGRFEVKVMPAVFKCECGHVYRTDDLMEPCPKCKGFLRALQGGEDITVSKLIVAEKNAQAV